MSAGRARTRFDRVAPSRGALEAGAAPVALASHGAQGIVRVHNLIAQFSIFGSPGNTEADPEAARALLAHVAKTL
jgi:hypothetical protein